MAVRSVFSGLIIALRGRSPFLNCSPIQYHHGRHHPISFRIDAELGGCSLGNICKAEDTNLGRRVALKFLASCLMNDATARERFIREARAAAMLQHECIFAILDVQDMEDGGIFILMPPYEERSLENIIKQDPL